MKYPFSSISLSDDMMSSTFFLYGVRPAFTELMTVSASGRKRNVVYGMQKGQRVYIKSDSLHLPPPQQSDEVEQRRLDTRRDRFTKYNARGERRATSRTTNKKKEEKKKNSSVHGRRRGARDGQLRDPTREVGDD